jgi:hypothetical protein
MNAKRVCMGILIAMFIMALICARIHRTADPFVSPPTPTEVVPTLTEVVPTLTEVVPTLTEVVPAPVTVAQATVAGMQATVAGMPAVVSEALFGKILAVYKQAVERYPPALQNLQKAQAYEKQLEHIYSERLGAYINTFGPNGPTDAQQIELEKYIAKLTVPPQVKQQVTQASDAVYSILTDLKFAQQLLDVAYSRRTLLVNLPVPVSSIQPQVMLPPAKTQMPLFLKNNVMWEPVGLSRSPGYLAATSTTGQTLKYLQPFLFDTLLLVIGSTISIQNAPTGSTFLLSSGYTYECRAEILTQDTLAYNWYANGVIFGSIGIVGVQNMTMAAVGYIKNNTSEAMRITIARSTEGDLPREYARTAGAAPIGTYIGSLITIKEIAAI